MRSTPQEKPLSVRSHFWAERHDGQGLRESYRALDGRVFQPEGLAPTPKAGGTVDASQFQVIACGVRCLSRKECRSL